MADTATKRYTARRPKPRRSPTRDRPGDSLCRIGQAAYPQSRNGTTSRKAW